MRRLTLYSAFPTTSLQVTNKNYVDNRMGGILAHKTGTTTLNDGNLSEEIVFNALDFNTNTDLFEIDGNDRIKCLFTGVVLFCIQSAMHQSSTIPANNQMQTQLFVDGLTKTGFKITSSSPDSTNSNTAGMYSMLLQVTKDESLSFRMFREGDSTGNTYVNNGTNSMKMSVFRIS